MQFDAMSINWERPDYDPIWKERVRRLAKLRADAGLLAEVKAFYAEHPIEFITDWGTTVDPRNANKKYEDGTPKPVFAPFLLFPQQIEFIHWIGKRYNAQQSGVLVKSRDCGASWMAMGYSSWMCMFHEGVTIGFGSAKEEKVDAGGNPDSLFWKGRKFMEYIPREFKGGWDARNKRYSMARHMFFPEMDSSITGDAGLNIGRGGRKSIWFIDEFAVVENSKRIEANLLAATDCVIEMSTVQGLANAFAEHARGGLYERFDFDYRDDPRKCWYDENKVSHMRPWFAEKKAKTDPIIWKQEYERDFLASAEGIIIPQDWVQAAIGAAQRLGLEISGEKRGSFDVADQGKDKNCFAQGYGIELQHIESWTGNASTTGTSTQRVYGECFRLGCAEFSYDGDGMGAGVYSDCERIEAERKKEGLPAIYGRMFRGSGPVEDPDAYAPGTERMNKDFFENYKAQSWWALRRRFWFVWNWVVNKVPCDPSEIISISPELPELKKTTSELSQPVWTWSKAGKMVIDKTPDDVASPNNADSVMMLYPYSRPALNISDSFLEDLYSHAPRALSEQSGSEQEY